MTKAKISVIGAGLMGHGIAQVFAVAGHDVTITDSFVQNLDTAKSRIAANLRDLGEDESAVARVRTCADLGDAVRDADYVVEAVSEDLALKRRLFAEVERHVRPDTILASNTSVIPITAIMQGLAARERALGTHWWNPPFLVPLVEVIETQWTPAETIAWTMQLHEAAGKKPAHGIADAVLDQRNGFAPERMLQAVADESRHVLFHSRQDRHFPAGRGPASGGRTRP
jgi:3-hydroxybutyryl-CoA dehydrogenase